MRPGSADSPTAKKVSGVTYVFDKNLFDFHWMRLDFEEGALLLNYEKPNGRFTLRFGLGKWQEIVFPENAISSYRAVIRLPSETTSPLL